MKKIGNYLCILTSLFLLSACNEKNGNEKYKEEIKINVAIEPYYAPFSYLEEDKLQGFDYEVMNAIAEETNMKVDYKQVTFDEVFETVKSNKNDAGISAISINEKRKKEFYMTKEYFTGYQLLVIRKPEDKIYQYDEIKNKIVLSQKGTTGSEIIGELKDKNKIVMKEYETMEEAIYEYNKGVGDYLIGDNGYIMNFYSVRTGHENFFLKDKSYENEKFGIIVNKENKELQERIEEGLKIIKAKGKYNEIYEKFFGNS